MNIAAAANVIGTKGDEAVDLAKILYQASRAPYDSRVSIGDKAFKNLYGQSYFELPFRNADLYKTQEDVLNAIATGKISNVYGANVLKEKFGILGLADKSGKGFEPKFKKMLNAYVNQNPKVQQQYEDLIYHGGLISAGGSKIGSQRVTKAAYLNRAIDLAMDPNYLKEYGDLPFRFKYMNALKDIVDPKASIYSIAGGTFSNALKQGEKIANARGLKVNFFPPRSVENPAIGVTGSGYQMEKFATVNNGRTLLPASLFAAREGAKAKKRSMSSQQFLNNFNIGDRLDTGSFEYVTPLRMSIPGQEGKTFYQIKYDIMNRTPGNKQRLDQINRLFEGNKPVITLDHVQPQRFGGTNDTFNLRYIFESGHFGGIRQTAKESDELTMFVGSKGQTAVRPTVTDKTNLEKDVYERTMKIVDLVKNNKVDEAQKLSDEVYFLVENFKKVNPGVDFKLGIPYVPVKTGKKSITYIPYYQHLKLNKNQIDELFLPRGEGSNALLQQYENLPNSGDTMQKSFDKAYEKLAPFIIQGEKLTEEARKGLFEMKAKGGAVGLQDGGQPGFFERVKKQFFEGQEYPYEVASNEPIENPLKDITPEQVIKVTDDIKLQPLEDAIKKQKEKYYNQYDNENLSPDTRQYVLSSKNYHQHLENKKMAISKAEICGITPDAPGCSDYFPNGKFFNELTGERKPLGPGTMYDVEDFYNQLENTDYFKNMFAMAKGEGNFAEAASNARKEMAANSIKKLPLATADFLLDFYQVLSPFGIGASAFQSSAKKRKGEDITREELADYIRKMQPSDMSEETIQSLVNSAFESFDAGIPYMPNVTGKVEDKFGRRVFMGPNRVEGRELSGFEVAAQYGITAAGFLPLVTKPTYTGKIMEVLGRKDIGTFGKVLRVTPRALGIPTTQDAIGILKLLKAVAVNSVKQPVKIYYGAGRYLSAEVKPGTENIFVVGSKTLPELGVKLPASEIAKRQNYTNMIKNTTMLIRQLEDQKVQEKAEANEKEYQAFKLTTLKPDFEYNDHLKHYYQEAIRSMVADPNELPFPDTDDIEYVSNLPFDPEKTPKNVIRYAKELANTYIEQNNLKRNTIGDMMFYDMKNKEEPIDIFEEDVETNVVPRLSVGGDPGQFTDPLRMGDDDTVDIQGVLQEPAYLGVDELDMFFEDSKLRPENRDEALPPEVQVANVVFGKAPGWAIAGANKVDDLLRGGNTGQRIAQADALADQAVTVGEKANRFFSGIEARLIDPNAPQEFARAEDLYNFLQSKGISKFEVEDYQIPQLIETMTKTGQPITKANLLERIKNAPIRKLKSYTRGFRSEVENADGQFVDGKYAREYYEKGSIPNSYRENILYLSADDIPGDVGVYKHSTHGFFPDDTTNYVIGWTRSTDRYAIIPGTKGQLSNIGPKQTELTSKIERLTKITNRSAEDIVNQSGGRVSLEQAQKNIDRAKKDLVKAQDELANVGKTDDAVVTGDQTVRVTFADEVQSDIMQTYRKHLEQVIGDYKKLVDKGIDVKDTAKIRSQGYQMDLRTDNDVLQFYAKNKSLMRPVFKTEEDFAAYINDIRKSQAVFKDFAKIQPGQMPPGALAAVREAGKSRDKVLTMFEEAFTNPETLKKLFPNIPFKDRKVWGDALIKNDLASAAKRKFVDKDANASDWYVISPAELVTTRYGQKGTTATPFAQRNKDMKGIGQHEFYGGPDVTDPNGKHFTGILEASLRRAAKANNTEVKVVKVQIGEPKSITRSVQIVNAQGDIVKQFKMAKSSKAEDFGDVMKKAQDYIAETGTEGLIARPIEIPSGFKTVDAYAIKLTPEMVLPTKTHLASGGYVRYDPLVSIDEMIGAA